MILPHTLNAMKMKDAIQEIGRNVNVLPREKGFSLPCVENRNGQILVHRFFYITRSTPNQGTFISQPTHLATYDWSRRKFVSLKTIDVKPAGLPAPPWKHAKPTFRNPAEIVPEFERIWSLYDILIPGFLAEDKKPAREVVDAAKEYLRYFDRHAEKPFLKYYQHFGGAFLDWVRAASSAK